MDLARTLIASFFIIMLAVTSLWVLKPFVPGMLWAAMIVITTWPLLIFLQKHLKGRRGPAVAVMTTVLALVVLVPLAMTFSIIVSKSGEVLEWSKSISQMEVPPPPAWLGGKTVLGNYLHRQWESYYQTGPRNIGASLEPYLRQALGWFISYIGSFGSMLVTLLVSFVLMGVFFASGEKVAGGLIRFARKVGGDSGENAMILAANATKGVALGIIGTTLVQSSLAGVSLLIAGVPHAGLITAFAVVFCLAQMGPQIPLFFGVGWLYSQGQNTVATLFLVWSLGLGLLDNFLRPFLIKKGANLPFLLIFSGVVGGFLAFGMIGLFIGPVILGITFDLLKAWVNQKEVLESPPVFIEEPQEQPPLHH